MRTRTWIALFAVVIVAGAGGAWLWAGRPVPAWAAFWREAPQEERADDAPDFTVKTAEVENATVPITFIYTGTIISPKDALLKARVTGTVIDRPFEPGRHVKEGEVLFRIDPRPFQVSLLSAKAQQQKAKSDLEFAQAEVSRTSSLAERGFATEQRLQQQQATVSGSQATLEEAEASIAREQLNLDYAVVTAPFDGRASLSLTNVGDLVTANQTELVTVVQTRPIDVQVALSAADSEAVRRAMEGGDVFESILDEAGKAVGEAKIYKLDNRFDPRTARRLVRALLPNAEERFLPGQFVRVRIKTGTEQRVLVPTIALSTQLAQQIVYTVGDDGIAHQRAVTTGDVFGDKTAVLNGVKPGERVVTDHLQEMSDGLKVKVEEPGKS